MKQLALLFLAATTATSALGQQSVASGQPRATSANYTLDGAIAIDASGVSASTNYTNRAGYVGQLYDVTALELVASPDSVNERGTAQLGAGATLDDGTLLVPAATEVAWAVVSGPVAAISDDGTATVSSVDSDTTATVQGSYQGFTATLVITVLDLTNGDSGPYGGDGLPDDWQIDHFGEGSTEAGPSADPDGDGQNNLLEFLAATDPLLADSVFKVRVEFVINHPSHKAVVFGPVSTGRTYRVLSSTDLSAPSWADISGPLTGTGGETTFTDTTAGGLRKFYRVQISNP